MEREVGEKFMCDGVLLEVVNRNLCDSYCYLYTHKNLNRGCVNKYGSIIGKCNHYDRSDKINVVFKKVDVMHINIMD